MGDARAALGPMIEAFGLPAVVTRPAPDASPITTRGFWIRPLHDERLPTGAALQRQAPRQVLVLPRAAIVADGTTWPGVPSLPNGSLVSAAEFDGAPATLWMVDGREQSEADCWRAILVLAR